jgi:hypothetical protein
MSIKEKLAKEDGTHMYCYKQGAFWVCYEQSAYIVSDYLIKSLQKKDSLLNTVSEKMFTFHKKIVIE